MPPALALAAQDLAEGAVAALLDSLALAVTSLLVDARAAESLATVRGERVSRSEGRLIWLGLVPTICAVLALMISLPIDESADVTWCIGAPSRPDCARDRHRCARYAGCGTHGLSGE